MSIWITLYGGGIPAGGGTSPRAVRLLRRQAADATEEKEADKLEGRIQLLYGMYLDCLHVGNYLIKCGRLR